MPGYFKKRRVASGPNKNEQKVMRGRIAENPARLSGTLESKFPSVRRLKVALTFLDARQGVLDEKALSMGPQDAAIFTVACPGRCGRGTFDFGRKVAETIEGALPMTECGAKCVEPIYAGAAEACACEVKCRIEAEYLPSPA